MQYAHPQPFVPVHRRWPDARLRHSPRWCAVDLRDGNQALPTPMSPVQKEQYFQRLVSIGFREIEIGFPASSLDDWMFCRALIERGCIPDGVVVSVLTQAREHILRKTMDALRGVSQAICHLYIPASELHRQFVLRESLEGLRKRVLESVKLARELSLQMTGSRIFLEFSPEDFTDSDLDFLAPLCDDVVRAWEPKAGEKVIINLPSTVERALPNHYPDCIEAFCERLRERSRMVISLHAHNDMGGAVASTELALLAGAERVEGTLLGNGERAGNTDLITLALNLQVQGIDTGLDFSNLKMITAEVSELTGMAVPPRQPYAGSLAFTAFSGSHQDAIHKCQQEEQAIAEYFHGWKMPYLHINPAEIGRSYERTVRINSQSGKGGLAYVLAENYGVRLPEVMLEELAKLVQERADSSAKELRPDEVWEIFLTEFDRREQPIRLLNYWPRPNREDPSRIEAEVHVSFQNERHVLHAIDDGPVAAFTAALRQLPLPAFRLQNYEERSIGSTVNAESVTIVAIEGKGGRLFFGVGFGANIVQGAVRAIVAGLNRMLV